MAKTALFSRKTPGGVWNVEDQSVSTGDRYFVGSTVSAASDAATHGLSPDMPFATLDYAVGRCTASQGDIVYVMPSHAETVATAAALDFDVAGIKVVGLGWGNTRPTVQLSANLSTVEFNADDMWIENIIFEGTFTNGVAVGLDIKTGCDDLYIKDCVIRGTLSTKELLIGVSIEATNDGITFDGCYFYDVAGGSSTVAILTEGAFSNLTIKNSRFSGDWATSVLDFDAAAVTSAGLHMEDVTMYNLDTGACLFLTLDNTTEATLLRVNTFGVKSNTLPLDAGDDGVTYAIECYGTDAAGTNGILWPATATAWT